MRKTDNIFESVNDDELAVLAQQGDNKAYNELCLRFFDYKKVKTGSGFYESEDLLQEGMFGFMNAVKSFSPERGVPFMAYAAICVNNCIKSVINKVNSDSYIPVAPQYEENTGIQPVAGPSELIEGSESVDRILDFCERELSETERSLIYYTIAGLSAGEAASRLGVSKKSAENALMRGRRKLREFLNS